MSDRSKEKQTNFSVGRAHLSINQKLTSIACNKALDICASGVSDDRKRSDEQKEWGTHRG
jgi:hypothetical protein